MNLIYDRTAQDVETARAQRGTALTPLKGCYNVSDLNRVESAVKLLAAALTSAGYPVEITPVLKGNKAEDREWQEGDIVRRAQWTTYLENVQRLRDAYYTLAETGALPKPEDKLKYTGANNIEKVLADIDLLIDCMKASYRRCGTFRAGNNAAHLPLKGSV
nr:MAG TPA: hypothetical protein [Caudoviricetes sp.]